MADLPAIRITAVDQASSVIGGVGRSLGAFAVQVVSAAAAVESIRAAINLGDDLKRMSDATGLSIAKLDQLSIVAKLNGANLEDMARAFKFLGGSMVEAQNASSQSGKLFAALGVSVKDASGNLRGVDDVMADTAKALNSIENETVRAAAGTAIFGKSYLAIAATLRNYTDDQAKANEVLERYGGVSATAAKLSDDLGDKFTLLGEGSKRALLGGLVPGMAAVNAGLDQLTNGGGQFQAGFGQVVSWIATEGTKAFVTLADVVQRVGMIIGATAAAITTGSLEPFREFDRQIEQMNASLQAKMAAISTAAKFPGLDDADQVSRAAAATERLNKAQVDSVAVAKALAPAQKEVVDEGIKFLNGLIAQENAIGATQEELLRYKAAELGVTAAATPLIDAIVEANAKVKDQKDRLDEVNKAMQRFDETVKKHTEERKRLVDAIEAQNDALKIEHDTLGMTDDERQRYIVTLQIEKQLNEGNAEAVAGLTKQYALLEQRTADKGLLEAAKQAQQAFEEATRFASDFFVDLFNNGKSAFKNLWESFKQMAFRALADVAAKQLVVSITGVAAGGIGGAANAAGSASGLFGGGGIGNLFSSGASLASSAAGGISGLFGASSFTAGLAGDAFMPAMVGAASEAAMAGMGSMLAPLLAAAPYLAIAAIAVPMIVKLFNKGGGPKQGGAFATGDLTATGLMSTVTAGRFGEDASIRQNDADLQKTIETIAGNYKAIVAALGGTAGDVQFGLAFDTDPKGTAANRVKAGATFGGQSIYSMDTGEGAGNIGRDQAVLEARLGLEAQRSLLAALQASSFPQEIADVLNSVTAATGSAEDIANVIKLATAIGQLKDAFGKIDLAAIFGEVFGVDKIKELTPAGGDLAATFVDLVNVFQATNTVAQVMGQDAQAAFGAVGLASLDARKSLVELVGGIDALNTISSNYYQAFYSASELLTKQQESLAGTFGKLNVAVPSSISAFRGLVEGLDLSTQAGREMFASLMQIAPAFAQVQAAAAQLASQATGQQIQILQLSGEAAAALALQRQTEMAALDPSLQAAQQQIYDLQDANAAAQAAADAAAAAAQAQAQAQAQIDAAQARAGAAADQRAQEQARIEEQNRTNLRTAYQRESSALQQTADSARQMADGLKQFRGELDMGSLSSKSAADIYKLRRAAFDAAGPENIQELGTAFLESAKAAATTRLDYQRDVAKVQAAVLLQEAALGAKATDAEAQLAVMKDQVGHLIDIREAVLSVADAILRITGPARGVAGVPQPDLAQVIEFDTRRPRFPPSEPVHGSPGGRGGRSPHETDAIVTAIDGLRTETRAANVAIAVNTGKTAKLLARFDGDGMPAVRTV